MGSMDFYEFIHGDSLREAFNDARSDAQQTNGHGGYSGTLAEKTDYVTITEEPLHPAAARALADRLMDADDPRISDKWGPAGVIAVAPSAEFHTRKTTITVSSDEPRGETAPIDLAQAALSKETVIAAEVLEEQSNSAVQVTRGRGRQQRQFEMLRGDHRALRDPCDTVAVAIAQARSLAERDAEKNTSATYSVRGVIVAADSGPLAVISSIQRPRRITLQVTLATAKHRAPQRPTDGWLVFGYAPS